LKRGLDHVLKYGYWVLPRFNSVGQHPVVMVPELLLPIQDSTADVGGGAGKNHGDGSGIVNLLCNLVM